MDANEMIELVRKARKFETSFVSRHGNDPPLFGGIRSEEFVNQLVVVKQVREHWSFKDSTGRHSVVYDPSDE